MKFHPTESIISLDAQIAQLTADMEAAQTARTDAVDAWWVENAHLFHITSDEDVLELIDQADFDKSGWAAWNILANLFSDLFKTDRLVLLRATTRYDPSGTFLIPFLRAEVNSRDSTKLAAELADDVRTFFAMLPDSIKHSNILSLDTTPSWQTVYLVWHGEERYGLHSGDSHTPFRTGTLDELLASV